MATAPDYSNPAAFNQWWSQQSFKDLYDWYKNTSATDPNKRQFGSVGGQQNFGLYQNFKDVLGRDPDLSEWTQYYNVLANQGENAARAWADQKKQLDAKNPDLLEKNAPQYSADINKQFQSVLGRDATADEQAHFGKLIARGDADLYTLGEGLKTLPEYTQKADDTARQNLRGELSTADQQFFQQKLMPSIQQQFALQGRSVEPDNPALANAFASAGNQINTDREKYLAGVGREDYVNQRQSTINDYLANLSQTQQQAGYNQNKSDTLANYTLNRNAEIQDFNMQKQAYLDYINASGKRKTGIGSTIGGLAGAGFGAYFGGPQGAMAGYQVGSSAGGLFDKY